MFRVLMVCTGNICRSPMAAGLLSHYLPVDLKERVEVTSAGTSALRGYPAQEYATEAMDLLGIDITRHRARQLNREIVQSTDLILTMEIAHIEWLQRLLDGQQTKPRLLMEFDHQSPTGDIHDPYGEPLEAYEHCVKTLRPCIKGVNLWLGYNI